MPVTAYIGLISAWVAKAATPPSTWIASAPTAKKRVATAAPRAPVAGSRARIDQVMRAMLTAQTPRRKPAKLRHATWRARQHRSRPAGRGSRPCRGIAALCHAARTGSAPDGHRARGRDTLYWHVARPDSRRLHL